MEPRFRRGRRRSPRRSRSPRYQREDRHDRISKALVRFGRYERNRPHGLMVSPDGGFMLDNLMDTWARAQGYRRDDVLEAVRMHMFHEDGESLRFEITNPGRGQDTLIKVRPRRGAGRDRDRFHEDRRPPRRRGGSLKEDSDREDSLPPPPPRSVEEKLDMSLDDLVSPSNKSAASSSREPFAHRETRVHHKLEQMGHTLQTVQRRRPPVTEGRPGSGDRAEPPRPRVKKPPVPMPLGKAFVKAAPAKPPPALVKVETSQAMDVDPHAQPGHGDLSDEGFEEEDEMPEPPPADGWQEYDDQGKTWWYYDGPKGKFACLGPGHEITKVED